ncbi:amidohydrolase family protein [Maribacter litopenaei]|uniref:Amidohydrolase family protein n=1 Tax=Maribacter litopenaei TaxID=2976127 RepID=A0ABY5Y7Y2_9FLAO|nr:amidohydrolase family protein [Maribacter litopenaei]UWX55117.1 amidohydrolase family protein [Maribacter litopenaei]
MRILHMNAFQKLLLISCHVFLGLVILSCSSEKKQVGTLLIHGGPIYTMDSLNPVVEAVVTLDNRILYSGSLENAEKLRGPETQEINLEGKTMTPGLIEGHGHFMGLGYNELNLDLINTKSFQEIIDAVADAVDKAKPGEWITGRGWHREQMGSTA